MRRRSGVGEWEEGRQGGAGRGLEGAARGGRERGGKRCAEAGAVFLNSDQKRRKGVGKTRRGGAG